MTWVDPRARIGISGWRYAGWRGDFYPPGLAQRRELEYAAERLTSIEVNGSFYSLQRASSWKAWAQAVPEDFLFAVKGPRFVTHMKKLADVEVPLANFYASGVLTLGERLGPFLWQLPPNLGFHPDRLAAFFDLLPRSAGDAARWAAPRHEPERLKGTPDTSAPVDVPLRHVLEVRHESFRTPALAELLRERAATDIVVFGGGIIPEADIPELQKLGVAKVFTPGATTQSIVEWVRANVVTQPV